MAKHKVGSFNFGFNVKRRKKSSTGRKKGGSSKGRKSGFGGS